MTLGSRPSVLLTDMDVVIERSLDHMTQSSGSRPRQPIFSTSLTWKATGPGRRDRVAVHEGHGLRLISVPDGYEVQFCGDSMGSVADLELAKRYVADHITEWIAQRAAHLEQQRQKQEADLAAGRARTARAAAAAEALRDLGVGVKDSHGLLSISVESAEELLAMLKDLRKIEERGHV